MLRRSVLRLLGGILALPFVSLPKKVTWNIKKGAQMRFHSIPYHNKHAITTLFERNDAFYRDMKFHDKMRISSREMRIPLKLEGDS